MSSILKALRKLEEEKAAIGDGGVDIARDILKRSAREKPQNHFWPLASAALFSLLIAVSAFLWFTFEGQTGKREPLPTVAERQDVVRQPEVVLPDKPLIYKDKTTPASTVHPQPEEKTSAVKALSLSEPAALRPDGAPFLKVTGIAYRKNPAERIAIINDLPVMQGTIIEGARVTEILPEKIVFNWQGDLFEQRVEKD